MSRSMVFLISVTVTLGTVLPAAAQYQSCVDNAVIQCFDTCTNPLNFQECIIGCAAGSSTATVTCDSQCFGDATCLGTCQSTGRVIAMCPYVTGMITSANGPVVLNRSTGYWQQTVKITNTSQSDTWQNAALIVDSLTPGWKLENRDGTTVNMPPAGSPYKTVPTLGPGQSTTVTLLFTRITQLPFGYVTRVVVSQSR